MEAQILNFEFLSESVVRKNSRASNISSESYGYKTLQSCSKGALNLLQEQETCPGDLMVARVAGAADKNFPVIADPLKPCADELQQVHHQDLGGLDQLQNGHKPKNCAHLFVMRWCKVVEILPVMRRTAPPDQLVPDEALLQQLPGHPVGLSQVQGGVEVEEWQQLLNQLWSPPKDLCSFTLSQGHLLSLNDPQIEVNLE